MSEVNFDTMTASELQTYLDDLKLLLIEEQEKGRLLAERVAQDVQTCWSIFNES